MGLLPGGQKLMIQQLDDNLLFRWFVGLNPDDPLWYPTTYGLRPTSSTPRTGTGCEQTPADGYGERAAAVRMAHSLQGAHQKTLGADKGYDTRDFVADLRISGITPHGAQNIHTRRRSAIDGRTVRHLG